MNRATTYEQELETRGFLIYTTTGCSMRPFLRSGEDMVYLERKPEGRCRRFDVVLYRRDSGRYVLHRIIAVGQSSYTLCGDNCWQREPGIRDDQILGVLTGVIRKGNRLDVNSRRYRLGVRLWCSIYPLRAAFLWTREKVWNIWDTIKSKKDK